MTIESVRISFSIWGKVVKQYKVDECVAACTCFRSGLANVVTIVQGWIRFQVECQKINVVCVVNHVWVFTVNGHCRDRLNLCTDDFILIQATFQRYGYICKQVQIQERTAFWWWAMSYGQTNLKEWVSACEDVHLGFFLGFFLCRNFVSSELLPLT